jgi:GNAT superfamily N-acetyltransferase
MNETLTLRVAVPSDLAAVDQLLSDSYPRLLAPDYPPSILVMALPLISRAQPALLRSGRYFLALGGDRLLAAGGWSTGAPGDGQAQPRIGHIRHVVTDYRHQRQGIGRQLMVHLLADAQLAGMTTLACLSTLTAVRFYETMGFVAKGPVTVPLRPGIDFPAVQMVLRF